MQQNGVYDLLKMLEMSLEEGFPIIPRKFTLVKTKEIEALIDRIYGSIPVEVQEAKAFLRRRDELQLEVRCDIPIWKIQRTLSKEGKSSQIDHLLINQAGIFVIETKNYPTD